MKKVFCMYCIYMQGTRTEFCCYNHKLTETQDDWFGQTIIPGNPAEINKNNDCEHFVEAGSFGDRHSARMEWLRKNKVANRSVDFVTEES